MADKLSHIDAAGNAVMVDISAKTDTARVAIAKGRVLMSAETARLIAERGHKRATFLASPSLPGLWGPRKPLT